ncbi:multiple C2 domain and transmembrane region protein 6 [Aegilops tauschii subsp. strangulata]|uniref:multiple C2 domain and transmembrane region protein 6 n=1 Tax=Aegilops tauschii subsp. strangulata TaxID=200361 RepID=UPI003CC841C7
MENIQKLRKSAVGVLEVNFLGARDLAVGTRNSYCVAKYGKKWVRTRTLFATAAPQWDEKYTWDVFDVSTVITIAVFDDSNGAARHQRIGKVRVRLATLETDRVYSQYYPLLKLSPSGLNKNGELHLAVRFTCKSWAKMLAMYGKPMLPKMHHTNPISVRLQDYLRHLAMQMVAKRLERAQPPLRREVVEYILDVNFETMFSLRRSKANFFQLMSVFSVFIAVSKWFVGICKWKNPLTTIVVHVVFLKLVCYPELILSTVFICMIMIALWNYPRRPRKPPHMVTELSASELAHPDELNEDFDSLQPPHINTMLWWYPVQAHPLDELDEEFDTFPTSKPEDVVQVRYDRLRGVAGRVQTVVGDLASQGERAQFLLRWRDPRVTPVFMTFFLVVAIVLYLTPFRAVAMVMGLYLLRPPLLRDRSKSNLLFNLYNRLPSNDDMML